MLILKFENNSLKKASHKLKILDIMNGNQLDIKVKAAKYIDKHNFICQEFYFAQPETKVKFNGNMHITQELC